ncbi:hypothetical protein GO279_04815 [Ralstonia solanacearum]|nr:hypothetical protein [Ralstonia solanacearum]NKA56139.1 hypothetical protein [Ralstonia solanacearum]NKA86301.1 hypothetical protein [Ralstonia solanacearum]NKF57709.1 hypothetical protein [Ralstonia solanacearum]NKF62624.1 hypothetical protein [Ralstonia solanacearum]
MAVVETTIERQAGVADRRLQLIAPVEAPVANQRHLAIEAPHGVAATDGDRVDRIQVVIGELPTERGHVPQRLRPQLERHRQVGVRHQHAIVPGRATAVGERVVLRAQVAHAVAEQQAAVELRGPEVMAVRQAGFHHRVVAPLLGNLGVVDEVFAEPLGQAKLHAQHIVLRALDDALQLDVEVLRIAARHEGLVDAGDLLEVRAGIRRHRRRPVPPRHRVEAVPAVGAALLVAEIQVLAVAHVEQVVQAQRVVDADAQVALQLAGRARARIVHRGHDRPGLGALDRDHHIAHARHVRGHELHVDVLAGDALHLLQALFEIAQVQEITGA